MSTFELIRDLHKDARGFRPSQGWMDYFDGLTDAAKKETWDSLCREMAEREADEARMELTAQREYETRIEGMVADYGIDRATAIRWDAEAFELDIEGQLEYHGSAAQEIEFFLYKQGIACKMFPMYVTEIAVALGLTERATEA